MRYYKYIWIILLALICVNCKKDEPTRITALTINYIIYDITTQDAIVTCELKTDASIQNVVLDYSTDTTFAKGKYAYVDMEEVASQTNQYRATLSSLTKGTKYYFRIRAINKYSSSISATEYFFTPATSLPRVITTSPTIGYTTATCGGKVTINGGSIVTARGVCYSKSHNPTVSNTKISAGSGTGSFTCNLTGLTENTTYYVRAYATNSKGTAYGSEVTFTTNKYSVPTVSTNAVSDITYSTARCGGNVTADGGYAVAERGICYSMTSNPTVSNTKISAGSGTGSFTCSLTGLKAGTTYYVRAYASNSKGTAYGTQVSFTTSTTTTTITYTASAKLTEATSYHSGLHTSAFDVPVMSHTFSNGTGTIIFNGVLTVIGKDAFSGCSAMTSITIPNSVTSIESAAFYNCDGLTSITIPNSVTSIGDLAFDYCDALTSIIVASGNSKYSSSNGVLFNYNKTTLIQYPAGKSGSYSIPNSVTGIADVAFIHCTGLTSVTIPNSVTSIGDFAFEYCNDLTSVTIPSSVTRIGTSPFLGCLKLTSISVASGNSKYSSSNGVLFNYDKTTLIQYPIGKSGSYSIPNSVTNIEKKCFL